MEFTVAGPRARLPVESQAFRWQLSAAAWTSFPRHTVLLEDSLPAATTTGLIQHRTRVRTLWMALAVLAFIKEIPFPFSPAEILGDDRNILLHFIASQEGLTPIIKRMKCGWE